MDDRVAMGRGRRKEDQASLGPASRQQQAAMHAASLPGPTTDGVHKQSAAPDHSQTAARKGAAVHSRHRQQEAVDVTVEAVADLADGTAAEHLARPAGSGHIAHAGTEHGEQAGPAARHAEGLRAMEPVEAAADVAPGQQSRPPGRGQGRGRGRGRGRGGRGRSLGAAAPGGQGKPARRQTRGQKTKGTEDTHEGEEQQEGGGGLGPQRRSLRSRKSPQHTADDAAAAREEEGHAKGMEERQGPRSQAAGKGGAGAISSGGVSLSVEWAGQDDDNSDAHDTAPVGAAVGGAADAKEAVADAKDSSDSDNVALAGLQQAGRRRSLPRQEQQTHAQQQEQGQQQHAREQHRQEPLVRAEVQQQQKQEERLHAEGQQEQQQEGKGRKRGRSVGPEKMQAGTLLEQQQAEGRGAKRGKVMLDDGAEPQQAGVAVEAGSQHMGQAAAGNVEPLQNGHAEPTAAPLKGGTERGPAAMPLQPPPPQGHQSQQQHQQQQHAPQPAKPASGRQALPSATKKAVNDTSSWNHGPESQQLRHVASRLAAAQKEFKEAQKRQQDIATQVEGYLAHMKTMAMSLELLRETHIGKAVTRISKWAAPDPACAKAAEAAELLCADWKKLLSKEDVGGQNRRQPSQESAEAPVAAAASLPLRKVTAVAKPVADSRQPPAKRRAVPDADGAPTAQPPVAPPKQGGVSGKAALRQDSQGGAAAAPADWETREEAALFHKRAREKAEGFTGNAVRDKAIALLVHALTPPDALPPEEAARRLEAALYSRFAQRQQLQQQDEKGAPAENGDAGGHMAAAAGCNGADPGVAYLRRLRVLWEWLLPGSPAECAQLRQRFLHCELAAAELASMSAEQVAALGQSEQQQQHHHQQQQVFQGLPQPAVALAPHAPCSAVLDASQQRRQAQQRDPDAVMPGQHVAHVETAAQGGGVLPEGVAHPGALQGKPSLDEWGAAGLQPRGAPDQAGAHHYAPASQQAEQTGVSGQEEARAAELPASPAQVPVASQQARTGGSGEDGAAPARPGWQSAPVPERVLWDVQGQAAAQQRAAWKHFNQNSQAGILFEARQPGAAAAAAGSASAHLCSGDTEPGPVEAEVDMDLEP